jgi:hypothetical protein
MSETLEPNAGRTEAGLTEAVVTPEGRITSARFELYQPVDAMGKAGTVYLEVVNDEGETLNTSEDGGSGGAPKSNVSATPGGLPEVVDIYTVGESLSFPMGAKGNTARLVANWDGGVILLEGLTLQDFRDVNVRPGAGADSTDTADDATDGANDEGTSQEGETDVSERRGADTSTGGADGRPRAPDAQNPFLRVLNRFL